MAIFLPTVAIILIIVGVLWYLGFRSSRKELYKHSKSIPGFPELPFIGNAHIIIGRTTGDVSELQNFVIDTTRNHGGISKFWLGPYLYITVTNPNYAEAVLAQALDRDVAFKFVEPWIGRGIISGNTQTWKKHRRLLAPAFHQKIMETFVDMFAEKSDIMAKSLTKEIGKGEFDIEEYLRFSSLDAIYKAILGTELHSQNGQNKDYVDALVSETKIVNARMIQMWLRSDFLFNLTPYARMEKKNLEIIHNFTADLIQKRKLQIEDKLKNDKNINEYENQFKFKTFLESVIEMAQNDKLSDDEIQNEVDTIISAGSDTAVSGSCFVLIILGSLHHIQDKVVDELKQIFGDDTRLLDKDDLPKMKYLECVIKETLRLFPLFPIMIRKLNRNIKLDKYTLPAGSNCVVSLTGLHRDKTTWGENADEFYPERFLPENVNERHPYSYIPFSAGIKNCLGMHYAMREMKTTIATILRSYKVSSKINYKNLPMRFQFLMRPLNGYFISIEKRTN